MANEMLGISKNNWGRKMRESVQSMIASLNKFDDNDEFVSFSNPQVKSVVGAMRFILNRCPQDGTVVGFESVGTVISGIIVELSDGSNQIFTGRSRA
jgi:hypothetical protein